MTIFLIDYCMYQLNTVSPLLVLDIAGLYSLLSDYANQQHACL